MDTDVFSSWVDARRDGGRWRTRLSGRRAALAFPTVAELFYGAAKDRWGPPRVARLEWDLQDFAVLEPDEEVARLCGQLRAEARRRGHPLHGALHANDLWIAACAVHYGLPLLTANRRHFADLPGLRLAD